MKVRPATPADAAGFCAVVRASIEELCSLDHEGDPTRLAAWLANKTVANVASWLANPRARLHVVERDGVVVGAGCVTREGEVVLNYVSPAARFSGVSSALLRALEDQAWRDGNGETRLDSTATARRFYRERGYRDDGPPGNKFGLVTFPMRKARHPHAGRSS